MSDIKLCYFGGSGGYIVLHLLLLSNQFHCVFVDRHKKLHDIIDQQWRIVDATSWKHTEHPPDNFATRASKSPKSKIYFFCNPTIENISNFDGSTVFLYTDAESQFELSLYKNAYIFFNLKNYNYVTYYREHLQLFKSHYSNVKDPAWPSCYGPKKFSRLPQWIQQEVMCDPTVLDYLNFSTYKNFVKNPRVSARYKTFSNNLKTLPNGERVMQPVFEFFNYADKTIKLQDVINNLSLLSDITHVPVDQAQIDLRNKWISLHSLNLLKSIGINSQWRHSG